jgi:hypothetical protein
VVKQFFDWCDDRRLRLIEIDALSVAAYIEQSAQVADFPMICRLVPYGGRERPAERVGSLGPALDHV